MAKKEIIKVDETMIDKEKVMREIKKEVKDCLLDELDKKIDGLVQVKIDKFEKKINKQKQHALFKKNIIIIILLGVVLFEGKILYDNGLLNNSNYKSNNSSYENKINKDTGEKVSEDKENTKDEKWYIEEYSYLLDNIKTNLVGDDFTYLYNDSYTAKDIENKIRLNMAYQLLDKEDIANKDGFLTVDASILEESYKKIFGNDLDFKNKDFTDSCIHFIYNDSLNKYLAVNLECAVNTKEVLQEVISVEEKEEKIIVTTILGIHDAKEKTISNLDNSFTKKYKDDITEYEEELDKFKYEFVKDNDTYYFSSITKEK